ncbi:MAG: hypothetical protein JWO03_1664 [Bacteroidetes bacterium]|nr:hypothetical protein [Bacteroidota bacterium]
MKYITLSLLFLVISICALAQNPYAATIKAQAETMSRFMMKKDYKAFAKYTYPKIAEMAGGEDKMIAAMTKSLDDMEKGGVTFKGVTIGDPGSAITVGQEIQCTVPQTLAMKIPKASLTAQSTLIAISPDGGKKWYFLDTSRQDLAKLQKSIPTLSDKLVLPKYPAPVVVPDK